MRVFNNLVGMMGKNFSVYRDENKICTVRGLYQGKYNINLPHDTNVQLGDRVVLETTQDSFIVERIDKIPCVLGDEIDHLDVYFKNPMVKPTTPRQVTYNVGTAYGSAFGDNATSNYTATYNHLEQVIKDNGHNPEEFQELLIALKVALSKEQCPKGLLSKFSDTLAKHSWLSTPVAQLLLAYATGHVVS